LVPAGLELPADERPLQLLQSRPDLALAGIERLADRVPLRNLEEEVKVRHVRVERVLADVDPDEGEAVRAAGDDPDPLADAVMIVLPRAPCARAEPLQLALLLEARTDLLEDVRERRV